MFGDSNSVDAIGKVDGKIYEEWEITDFFSIAENKTKFYDSPRFSFNGASWMMQLYPKSMVKSEFITLYLVREFYQKSSVEYNVGLKKRDGDIEQWVSGIINEGDNWSLPSHFKLSEIKERKTELLHSGALIITCKLKREGTFSDQPKILEENKLKKLKSNEFLCDDYKKVFLEGENHDIILKVGDKEFRAHRDILRARSRVFASMLSHNMKEKNSGVIDVPDCDSQTMEQFLLYLYCGKIETLNENNMLGLYYAADKYERVDLKEECCDFIKDSLSLTNICEVVQLALNYNDSELLDCAVEYFSNNMQEILRTVEWQSFMKENSTRANELLIKSIDTLKNTKI